MRTEVKCHRAVGLRSVIGRLWISRLATLGNQSTGTYSFKSFRPNGSHTRIQLMGVKIGSTCAAEEADIISIEQAAGMSLPEQLKQFFRTHDGAEPETNIFDIESSNDSGVNRFIPARQILSEQKKVAGLSLSTIPIAWAEGGNLVVMDVRQGSVMFWDHETDDTTWLANSLGEFLEETLRPFSLDDIELKPGQVKRVWVDPKLLEELEDD